MERRQFISAAGLATVTLACQPTNQTGQTLSAQPVAPPTGQPALPPLVNVPGAGRRFWGPGGDQYEFRVTGEQSGGSTFILHAEVPPGGGPPPHIHTRESESYYVEAGELLFSLGEETKTVKAGDVVHIPKGTVHTFTNKGTTLAKMMVVFAPAGMEGWFEEVLVAVSDTHPTAVQYTPKQLDGMIEAGPRHGVVWKLPPPPEKSLSEN